MARDEREAKSYVTMFHFIPTTNQTSDTDFLGLRDCRCTERWTLGGLRRQWITLKSVGGRCTGGCAADLSERTSWILFYVNQFKLVWDVWSAISTNIN